MAMIENESDNHHEWTIIYIANILNTRHTEWLVINITNHMSTPSMSGKRTFENITSPEIGETCKRINDTTRSMYQENGVDNMSTPTPYMMKEKETPGYF